MHLRVRYTFFIFVLIAEIILASKTSPKIAIAADPESQDGAHTQNAPAVDLLKTSVLVLHTFQANMPLNIKADQGIRTTLEAAGVGVKQQFFEYLDLARDPGPEHRQQLAEMLRLRFAQRKIDVVITLELGALQFVLNEGRDLFPDAPVLALDLPPTFDLPQTNRRIIQQSIKYNMEPGVGCLGAVHRV